MNAPDSGIRRIDVDLGDNRVETGAVQFNDDWPGVFIRGDVAGYYGMTLSSIINQIDSGGPVNMFDIMILRGMLQTLRGCIVGPAAEMF